jgi:L-proline amide hydrolase
VEIMTPATEGYAGFEGHQTWYRIVGELPAGAKRDRDGEAGGGPAPLVTLHGGPGATHDYLLSLADLATGGRAVIFYDQTGNGKSTHFPDRGADYYTVDLFRRELDNLIGHLGIGGRYHVLGQSWGGMLAQEHALTRPPGLRSVTLSNTAASFGGFAAESGSLRDWSVAGRLGEITAPTLVISGRHDEATPKLQAELVTGIAGAEQVILENSSHMPFWEERENYMAAVGDFLYRHDEDA